MAPSSPPVGVTDGIEVLEAFAPSIRVTHSAPPDDMLEQPKTAKRHQQPYRSQRQSLHRGLLHFAGYRRSGGDRDEAIAFGCDRVAGGRLGRFRCSSMSSGGAEWVTLIDGAKASRTSIPSVTPTAGGGRRHRG